MWKHEQWNVKECFGKCGKQIKECCLVSTADDVAKIPCTGVKWAINSNDIGRCQPYSESQQWAPSTGVQGYMIILHKTKEKVLNRRVTPLQPLALKVWVHIVHSKNLQMPSWSKERQRHQYYTVLYLCKEISFTGVYLYVL